MNNFNLTTECVKVDWFGFKTIKMEISFPNQFKYQLGYEDEEFTINLCGYTPSRDIPRPIQLKQGNLGRFDSYK